MNIIKLINSSYKTLIRSGITISYNGFVKDWLKANGYPINRFYKLIKGYEI